MRLSGGCVVLRVGSIMLLLLALSPFTTPFLTCGLADLLGGTATPGGAILQSKTAPDEPAPAPSVILDLQVLLNPPTRRLVRFVRPAHSIDAFHIPLRI
jgi:hypothetical protein